MSCTPKLYWTLNVGHIKVTPLVTEHAYFQQKLQKKTSISKIMINTPLNSIQKLERGTGVSCFNMSLLETNDL